jgi:pimeloyl-ACP methyl ester carboxylesterase
MRKSLQFITGAGLGALTGYALFQQIWRIWQLANVNVEQSLRKHRNAAPKGLSFAETTETDTYTRRHTVEDGIERIVYTPKHRRFDTPIVMQHGMWHGAWCWELWQVLFAEWGWETHAHSLPGHSRSALQRPIARCTLDYYLGFLKAEIDRLPCRPVLMGHSMGGALTQWYLKFVADDLPAAVLVAPWVSHSMFGDGLAPLLAYDPIGLLMMLVAWDATPMVRDAPGSAVRFLVGPQAAMSLKEILPHLGPESFTVLWQHNPPFWTPPEHVSTPMLWLAGEEDPLIGEPAQRRSAAHYRADYIVAAQARHSLMVEHNYRQTARSIRDWLAERVA